MAKRKTVLGIPKCGHATSCGSSSAPDCSAPIAPLQSAFANIQTAQRDCEAAGDFLGAMDYAEAVVWIDNAITGLQSAKAKVIASQNTGVQTGGTL